MSILVTGSGPAGVAAAIGLARGGFEVWLLSGASQRPRLEGLSARTREALESAGCRRAAALAAEAPAQVARFVSWGSMQGTVNHEALVDRAEFDAALRQDARDAGVRLLEDSLLQIELDHTALPRWHVRTRSGRRLRAAYWVDARGRSTPRAPGDVRGPASVALAVPCEVSGGPRLASALVAVERGFFWVVARERNALAQWFCDADREAGSSRRAGEIETELASLRDAAGPSWLARLYPSGATPYGRDATPSQSAKPIGAFWVRVGDAAAATDPLSGQGVFNALTMARAATACARTQLERPAEGGLAERFYRDRVATIYWRNGEKGRSFYREERRWPETRFWSRRASTVFEPPTRLPLSPEVATRPVLHNGYIETGRVLLTPADPEGVWRVEGVPIVELMEADPASHKEWSARFAVTPAQLEGAEAWLRSRGIGPSEERKRGERLTAPRRIPQSDARA